MICLTGHDRSSDRFGRSLTSSENLTGQPDRANPEFASNGFIHLSASHVRIWFCGMNNSLFMGLALTCLEIPFYFALDLESDLASEVPDCDDDVLAFDFGSRRGIWKMFNLKIVHLQDGHGPMVVWDHANLAFAFAMGPMPSLSNFHPPQKNLVEKNEQTNCQQNIVSNYYVHPLFEVAYF